MCVLQTQALTILPTEGCNRMLGTAAKMAPQSHPEERALQLLVQWNAGSGWWSSLRALLASYKLPALRNSTYFRDSNLSRSQLAGRSLTASFLMHCALIMLVVYLPQ